MSSPDPELVNDAGNRLLDSCDGIQQEASFDKTSLIERYLKQEMWVMVQFSIRERFQYISLFQNLERLGRTDESFGLGRVREDLTGMLPGPVLSRFGRCEFPFRVPDVDISDGSQSSVFVDVVKLAQQPEIPISSLIWTARVDSFFRTFPASFNRSLNFGCVKFLGALADREIDGIQVIKSTSALFDEDTDRIIEGAPITVENVPCDRRYGRRDSLQCREPIDRQMVPVVSFDGDSVWVYPKSLDVGMKILDVLIGPLYSGPDGFGMH
jgi:hypothetical protein